MFSALFSFSTLTSFTTLTKENDNNLLKIFENESIVFNNVRDGIDPADTNDVYQLTELQVVEDNTYVNIFGQVEGTIDLITNVSANRYLGEYQREI